MMSSAEVAAFRVRETGKNLFLVYLSNKTFDKIQCKQTWHARKEKSMKILAVANQKGGVGKSTLCVHLAYYALEKGLRVLLVDMDKQGSLSLSFPPETSRSDGLVASQLYRSKVEREPEVLDEGFAIVRADDGLLAIDKADNEAIRLPGRALRSFGKAFDLCIIDTPPLLGVRLMASLVAASHVLTPVSIGIYELAGVGDLLRTIHAVRTQGFNAGLKHIGILPIKTNSRSAEEKAGLDMLRRQHRESILNCVLPERAAVRKAVAMRRPVWLATRGQGHYVAAREWRAACQEIIERMGK